jgi:hypothetical protein
MNSVFKISVLLLFISSTSLLSCEDRSKKYYEFRLVERKPNSLEKINRDLSDEEKNILKH